jgi:hypothetical protein
MSFLQLSSIFPLIAYVIRIQFFGTFFNNNYPSFLHILIFGIIAIITCFFVLIFFINKLATFIGFIGAGTGLFLIYVNPLIVNIIYYKIKHPFTDYHSKTTVNELKQPINQDSESPFESMDKINEKDNYNNIHNNNNNNNNKDNASPKANYAPDDEYFGSDFGLGVSEKKPNKLKDNFFYFTQYILILFGVFTLILQFYQINFFNVELK